MESQRFYLRAAAILGALTVLLGAFGAHGLKSTMDVQMTAVYETAVRYHFYHALAILAVAVVADCFSSDAWWRWASEGSSGQSRSSRCRSASLG